MIKSDVGIFSLLFSEALKQLTSCTHPVNIAKLLGKKPRVPKIADNTSSMVFTCIGRFMLGKIGKIQITVILLKI